MGGREGIGAIEQAPILLVRYRQSTAGAKGQAGGGAILAVASLATITKLIACQSAARRSEIRRIVLTGSSGGRKMKL